MGKLTILFVVIAAIVGFALWIDNGTEEAVPTIKAVETDNGEVTSNPSQLSSGVLRILVWEGHAPSAHVSQFVKHIEDKFDYRVKLEITYMKGTDEFYNLVRGGSVDIVMLTHDLLKDERFNFIAHKLLLPLDLMNIPNFKHVTPSLQKAEYLSSKGQVYASPESQGPYALAYNPSLLEKAPNSWDVLWEPRFKGKYVIGANEYIYNAHITALALGYPRESLSSFDALNNPAFRKKFRELAENAHSFWIGVDKADDLSGHTLAAVWGDSFSALKKRGELWAMAVPVEGIPFWIDNCAITSALAEKPILKKIAEEYINSLLATDYQVGNILRVVGTIPTVTNIEHLLTPEEKKRIHIETPAFYDENQILLPTYSQRDRNGIKLLWEEATKDLPHANR